jgi:hypothetical protein
MVRQNRIGQQAHAAAFPRLPQHLLKAAKSADFSETGVFYRSVEDMLDVTAVRTWRPACHAEIVAARPNRLNRKPNLSPRLVGSTKV